MMAIMLIGYYYYMLQVNIIIMAYICLKRAVMNKTLLKLITFNQGPRELWMGPCRLIGAREYEDLNKNLWIN